MQFLPLDDLREANNIDIVTESTEVRDSTFTRASLYRHQQTHTLTRAPIVLLAKEDKTHQVDTVLVG